MTGVLGVFAAAFAFYLGCLYPAIAPRDSADMATAAMTLGVAHPPGYPLYSVLGHAWMSVFPWANSAYRLNVLSALAGAIAVSILFASVKRRSGAVAAATAAALWAFSAPLWKFSLLEEKYALHALFSVALFSLSEGARESVFRRARLSGLLLGLGLVNHQSLLFLIPALLWLWRAESERTGVPAPRLAAAAVGPVAAGLSLYAFLWVRMGSLGEALATALRTRYGAGTLFAGFARPLTPETGGELLEYALRESAVSVGWPAAAAAVVGAAIAWRAEKSRTAAWLAGAVLAGPLFVLLSRFDPSNWVARSVLEPAFLLPALILAAFAGEAIGALRRDNPGPAAAAALALVAASLFLRAPVPEHRDDFLAYDYARDLRRAVPPGGALLASGDTASFSLRWLALAAPRTPPLDLGDARLIDASAWLAAHAGRGDVFVTGVGPADLRALGLPSPANPLAPAGLVQRVGVRPPLPAPPSVLRRPRAWTRGESYAGDARLSYAFSSWASARLLEAQGLQPSETLDLTAVSDDPEDYRLQ
ncbi:MAG: protein O-mannosyl-transferase family [Elusimicrobiota bacterium]